jgi:Spy/CpxP family protein refolding chaperone
MKSTFAKRLLTMVAGGAIVLSSAGSLALAHEGWDNMKPEKKQELMDDFFKAINATPDQKKQFVALHEKYATETEPLKKSIWDGRQSLMDYVFSASSTPEEAARRQDSIEQNEKQLQDLELKAAFDKKALLTPEQQKKALAFFDDKAEQRQEKHEQNQQKDHELMNKRK